MDSNWKELEGKRLHIQLRNGYEYNCVLDKVDDAGNGLVFLWITDKFGEKKIIASGEIKFLEVKP
jgi:hypothetical protein